MRRFPALVACMAALASGHLALAAGPATPPVPPPPAPPSAGTAPAATAHIVVLWRLASLGLDSATASRVTEVLRAQLAAVPGFTLVPKAKVQAAAKDDPTLDSCTAAAACAAKVGAALDAPLVVTGVLSTVGDARSLDLRLVDAKQAKVRRRIAESWTGGANSLLVAMRSAATRLLAPRLYRGTVALTVSAKHVKVYLDGDYVGRTPVAPFHVTPGRHALRLSAAGYPDFQRFVDVPFGHTVPVKVTLAPLAVAADMHGASARGRLTVGVALGLSWNLGALGGGAVLARATYGFAVGPTRLELGVESGVDGAHLAGATTIPGAGQTAVKGGVTVVPVAARLGLDLLPHLPFSPYLALVGGVAFTFQSVTATGYPEQRTTAVVPTLGFAVGFLWRMGPGALDLSLRLQGTTVPKGALVPGPATGLGLEAGYAFFL